MDANHSNSLPSPALAICGYSNAGKTTLLLQLIPELTRRGLKVAVLKHDVHGLNIDTPGKDSDRIYQAGADVVLQGPEQSFVRLHGNGDAELEQVLANLCRHYDLVLVEGRKHTPFLDKVWLRRSEDDVAPEGTMRVTLDLGRDDDRLAAVVEHLENSVTLRHQDAITTGGMLTGAV
ncbi:MAG: molybdopterin-guanine dinucleotide biosynthesis protein B [Kiritimatiellia bacterium]|nr:molybdopterin-guanine dinucleotide biosynthesis protein B [Kiritimatiellia bacterium]MDP6630434.1 molybdopterin-guanine dinucleotide biosynthesis protein B [Kiritimatiellia bacterium]MDP6809891.1 molybdopterin-guanine dinucleotide biosynthesis protein B [Kiritimatiellia bacterium]MDP7024283.1 molybdopterin-guanine dinucleotide biosynthesis protein B [Kiritimatiellia bacterium]